MNARFQYLIKTLGIHPPMRLKNSLGGRPPSRCSERDPLVSISVADEKKIDAAAKAANLRGRMESWAVSAGCPQCGSTCHCVSDYHLSAYRRERHG